jgi:hypothetical protein
MNGVHVQLHEGFNRLVTPISMFSWSYTDDTDPAARIIRSIGGYLPSDIYLHRFMGEDDVFYTAFIVASVNHECPVEKFLEEWRTHPDASSDSSPRSGGVECYSIECLSGSQPYS